jgi:hypothetical protein
MAMKQVDEGHRLLIEDPMIADFIYVNHGKIKVHLWCKRLDGTADVKYQYFNKGQYIDDLWKKSKFPDYTIKDIVCLGKDHAEEQDIVEL